MMRIKPNLSHIDSIALYPTSKKCKDRITRTSLIIGVMLFLLVCRLAYLQVIKGNYYKELSKNNHIKIRILPAIRGNIIDRNGYIIADSRPAFRLILVPEEIKDKLELFRSLAPIIGKKPEDIGAKYNLYDQMPAFLPRIIERDLMWDQFVRIKARLQKLPGADLEMVLKRYYPYGELFGHITGYISEISKEELSNDTRNIYRMGDMVGKTGIEAMYEDELRGTRGQKQLEVDAYGRPIRVLNDIKPTMGNTLITSIDLPTQMAGHLAFVEKRGAAIAIDPKTGIVLALISKPSYNPNCFSVGIDSKTWQNLIMNPYKPLINKAVHGIYAPGSCFKPVVALAGLEDKTINSSSHVFCPGYFWFGKRAYRCWKKGGHRSINVIDALSESCDVFFYSLGNMVGIDKIAFYANMLGLGIATGIDLPKEKTGLIPSKEWKKKAYGVKWYSGETLSCAIGQGYITATPLQMAVLMASIANGRFVLTPRVGLKIINSDNKQERILGNTNKRKISISSKNLSIVRQGLLETVEGNRGTGRACQIPGIKVAGKTGTVQVVKLSTFKNFPKSKLPEKYKDHAWFIAYAPFENPKIAVSVLVEHGEHGATAAVPVAKTMIEAYFRGKNISENGELNGTIR